MPYPMKQRARIRRFCFCLNRHVGDGSSPNRIELVMVGRREPVTAKLQEVLSKVPSLKEAINRGLATVYDNVLYDQQILED